MSDEKIKVRITATGHTMDVVVHSMRADRIEIILGEGAHNVRCEMTPTRQGLSYVGNAMGREIIYERSRDDVQAEIDKRKQAFYNPKRR